MAEQPVEDERRYLSYLLRLWREAGDDPSLWRASLEMPQDSHRMGFASLADLFAFLEDETGSSSPGSQPLPREEKWPADGRSWSVKRIASGRCKLKNEKGEV